MSKKLYVGNLSFYTTESEVRSAFEEFGAVQSVAIISDRETGRSKGFGFIEMNDDDAARAISALHGRELSGRVLTVNEARPMVRRNSGDGQYRGSSARQSRY
jgi:RNA recognition motif-containing protein